VFWLTGGTHHSLAIAMRDHIVLVDTPNGEARASAVIAKAKGLMPNKPIRFVVAMHHPIARTSWLWTWRMGINTTK
jgi:flavorubredoxin